MNQLGNNQSVCQYTLRLVIFLCVVLSVNVVVTSISLHIIYLSTCVFHSCTLLCVYFCDYQGCKEGEGDINGKSKTRTYVYPYNNKSKNIVG